MHHPPQLNMAGNWKNGVYAKQLAVIQKIRERAGGVLEIPQICVLGDQGSGKSSLLSSIVPGLRGVLPTGRGTVTRCPTVVHVTPGDTEAVYIAKTRFPIETPQEKEKAKDALLSLQKTFLAKANEAVSSESEREDDEDDENEDDVQEVENNGESPVCDSEITVKYEGPNVVDLVLVDLPGLIQSGPGVGKVEEMARRHIEQLSTLIVIIREADLDEERAAAVKLASMADPKRERTLQVLTKCDSFSKPEGKEEVIRLVSEQAENCNDDSSLTVHLTCCDPKDSDEEQYFRVHDFNQYQNVGSRDLATRRLPHLLVQRISGCKPSLLRQILDKQGEARNILSNIGRAPQNTDKICMDFCDHIGDVIDMEEIFSPILPLFNDVSISEEWTHKRHTVNKFEPSFYQGLRSFQKCVKDAAHEFIQPRANALCSQVAVLLDSLPQRIFEGYTVPSNELKQVFTEHWRQVVEQMVRELQMEVGKKVKAESLFATTNDHYLQATYLQQLFTPESVVGELARAVQLSHVCALDRAGDYSYTKSQDSKVDDLLPVFTAVLKSHFTILEKADSSDFQKKKLHAAVTAYWKVARKRVSDTLMQCIRDVVIHNGWSVFCRRLPGIEEIKKACTESGETARLREKYLKLESNMEACLCEIETL